MNLAHALPASMDSARLFLAWAGCAMLALPAWAQPAPSLKGDTAIYSLETGVLQYAFTLENPGDSAVFLDCQLPPRASLQGSTLILDFNRRAAPAPAAGAQAGDAPASSPASPAAASPDQNDFPPKRVGARQTFRGQRRLDRLVASGEKRPVFTTLELRMDYYPEGNRLDGAFDAARPGALRSVILKVARRGKVPPPPKVRRHHLP